MSLGTGLATLGGLFAALRILLLFVQEYNRRHFERSLAIEDPEVGNIKEKYSIEAFRKIKERLERLENGFKKDF